jgi:hypothetical protein
MGGVEDVQSSGASSNKNSKFARSRISIIKNQLARKADNIIEVENIKKEIAETQ